MGATQQRHCDPSKKCGVGPAPPPVEPRIKFDSRPAGAPVPHRVSFSSHLLSGGLVRNDIFILAFLLLISASHAAQIKGVITDTAGKPVQDASVWLMQEWEGRETKTAADGAYVFEQVKVAVTHVCAWKEGHAIAGYSGFLVGDGAIDLQLSAPAAIDLKVVNGDFKVVPGAHISMLVVNDQFTVPVDELLPAGFPPLRADDSGALRIPFVPEGGFVKFALSHFQYRDALVNYLPTRDKVQQLVLYPGTKIQGQITYAGKGLPNARVMIYTLGAGGQNFYAQVLTDNEGLYGLRLDTGRYQMAVRYPDYASPKPLELEVLEQDEPIVRNLEMRKPFKISGAIQYPDASPCGGVRVQYSLEQVVYEETFSDNDGVFNLKIPENTGELIILPPAGYQTDKLPVIPLKLDDAKRDIALSPILLKKFPEISGKVIDPEGKALGDVLITVSNLTYPVWARTGEDGAFSITLDAIMQDAVALRFEDAHRFYRKDVAVELAKPTLGNVRLEEFKPEQKQGKPIAGQNDLSGLVGEKAPELECAQWFNAEKFLLKELKGKIVVLNFWAGFDMSPLGLSRLQELQQLQALYKDDADIVFVGVHDATSEAEEVQEYIKGYGITYPVGLDKEPFVSFELYHANFIPQTVLIDRKGKVQYYHVDGRLLELIKVLRRR